MDDTNKELWVVVCAVANMAPNTGMVVLHSRTVIAVQTEIERLRAALSKANDQAERFERGWYLRGDALEWYRDETKALAKNMAGGAHTSGVLASVTVLALDAGQRADTALTPNV